MSETASLAKAEALRLKGNALEAEKQCRILLMKDSTNPKARLLLAFCLQDQDRPEEAAEQFSAVLAKEPENYMALYSKAVLLLGAGKLTEAIWYFDQVIEVKPEFPHSYNSLGLAYQALGENAKAMEMFEAALKHQPEHLLWRLRRDSQGEIFFKDNTAIDRWRANLEATLRSYAPIYLNDYAEEISSSYAMPYYYMAYQGRDNRRIFETYGHLLRATMPPLPEAIKNRIGFVVTASTPMVFLTIMGGVLEHWDHARQELYIFCYPHSVEKIREFIHNPKAHIVPISSRFMQAVHTIRQQACGLLYYWEVGSDSTNYFMPHFRLAPIQCTSWGTFHTTGNPQMDYFLSSKHQEPPEAESHYSEKLHLLNHLPTFCKRLKAERPLSFRREDFGFNAGQKLYLCPQHLCKVHPDFEEVLKGIALKDPEAVLIFVESGKFSSWGRLLRERLQHNLADYPCQIVFLRHLSREKYFELIRLADVLLDTFHFGGGMTTLEAFSFGLPIVTLPGEFMRGRFTYACYRVMEIEDCIAEDIEDYVQKAFHIANDKAYAAELRQRISERAARLYENHAAVTEFQDFCDMAMSKGK